MCVFISGFKSPSKLSEDQKRNLGQSTSSVTGMTFCHVQLIQYHKTAGAMGLICLTIKQLQTVIKVALTTSLPKGL